MSLSRVGRACSSSNSGEAQLVVKPVIPSEVSKNPSVASVRIFDNPKSARRAIEDPSTSTLAYYNRSIQPGVGCVVCMGSYPFKVAMNNILIVKVLKATDDVIQLDCLVSNS
jgi:hypothetical protein